MTKTGLVLLIIAASAGMAAADELAVTVYNSNLGVVSETRQLEFSKGIGKLAFRDVPSQIDAASVDVSARLLGRTLRLPLVISGMTGGHGRAIAGGQTPRPPGFGPPGRRFLHR